jgi:ATP-dependent Lhr-like helicase
MLSEGITTGRGRRGAYLHRDRVAGVLRGRRGARLAALTSGGAIPETGDYRVLAEPDDQLVGTVGEDWAIESMAGDIFLLGSTSWQIRRVQNGIVRVADAKGAPPTIPFWVGEAPARSNELSAEVSELRVAVGDFLERDDLAGACAFLVAGCGLDEAAAEQLVDYLKASYKALGALPSCNKIVFERFFDESGGMQLVVHSPLGGRLNRGFGLALRKRFCKSFDFELQAAANDDAIVLSLGPQHSFPLADVPRFLHSGSVEPVLSQAVLDSPMFAARWRWNLNRSLTVLRSRGGKRNPPPIQRMESDDLMAAVFPGLAACQENQAGPIEIPDHPLVNQTLHDCLHEAMDIDALQDLLRGIESRSVETHFIDSTEPSPLSHEILNGRPYTFLDNAPLEERRTRAVSLRRGLPVEARELGRLDPEAIDRVRDEARPEPRDPDELHDLLQSLLVTRPDESWQSHFEQLVTAGRALRLATPAGDFWCAVERRKAAAVLFPDAVFHPDGPLPEALVAQEAPELEAVETLALQGHLDCSGPVTVAQAARLIGVSDAAAEAALARLEGTGFALRGHFETAEEGEGPLQFCARRLLTRIHRYTQDRLRSEIEAVTAQDFMRFLLRWQHVAPDTQREGSRGVLAVVEQLQGFELGAGSWEESLLPARVDGYRSRWLDELCLSGEVVWGRLSLKAPAPAADDAESSRPADRGGASPSRATPLSLLLRADLPWLLQAARGEQQPQEPGPGPARDVLDCLRSRGALFHRDLAGSVGRLPVEIEEGLWDLVARGLVTADGFGAVRSLLAARERWARRTARGRARRGLRRGVAGDGHRGSEGRWGLFPSAGDAEAPEAPDRETLAEAVAEQLLARWGVVFRDLLARENLSVPWRDVLWAFRRLEARGTIRGGRFVTGFVGEQYALPDAVDALRRTRKRPRTGEEVSVSGTDPLNLVGILTPGKRVPALRSNRVVYRDGLPVDPDEPATDRPSEATLH